MSGVYIPNWEKPKNCDDCWAEYAYEICNSHSDSCPLIAVPDHGRLIDADALEELFREVIGNISKRDEIKPVLEHMVRASAMVVEMIKDAPTIIPADKYETPCEDCPYDECSIPKIGSCDVADKDGD